MQNKLAFFILVLSATLVRSFIVYSPLFRRQMAPLSCLQPPIESSSPITNDEQPLKKPVLTARIIAWTLKRIIILKTALVTNIAVTVKSPNNRQLILGKLQRVDLSFDKIALSDALFVSGGGKVTINDLEISKRLFFFSSSKTFLRKPFTLSGDFLLTQVFVSAIYLYSSISFNTLLRTLPNPSTSHTLIPHTSQ